MKKAMIVGLLVILVLNSIIIGYENNNINATPPKIMNVRGYTPHGIIRINSNGDFTAQNGVIRGSGTKNDPYIISGWYIDAHGAGNAIYIGNTTAYFVVGNCYLHNASYHSWPYFDGDGITLYNVINGKIAENIIANNWGGIYLKSSSSNTISGNNITNNRGPSIHLSFSNSNTINRNNITSNGGSGVYLDVSHSNTISGNNIASNGGSGIVLIFSSNSNTISGNNIASNGDSGIYLDASHSNTISGNNIASNGDHGIYVWYSSNNMISGNNITNNGDNGIYVRSSPSNTISKNSITNNGADGIYLRHSSSNKIGGNIMIGNSIFLWGNDTFTTQTIYTNNTVNGKPVYYYKNANMNNASVPLNAGEVICGNVTWLKIEGLNLLNGSVGIELGYSSHITISGNNITNNSRYGIYLYFSSSNKIGGNRMIENSIFLWGNEDTYTTQTIYTNNTVNGKPVYYYKNANMNNASVPLNAGEVICGNVTWLKIEGLNLLNGSVGIELGYSSHIMISGNKITNNRYGIYLRSSSSNTISGNSIASNGADGIYGWYSSNNTISGNNIISNGDSGIYLCFSSSNMISGNNITNNSWYGILMWYYSNNNTIIGNNISSNQIYGVYIGDFAHNNLIYANIFYYNNGSNDTFNSSHVQANDRGSNNYWNSSSGIGNYWHDWANNNDTNDQNHDGIVDWPYNYKIGAKDYYPLKNPSLNNVLSHPMNLTARAGKGYVNITWGPPAYGNDTVTEYHIYCNGTFITSVPANQLYYNDTNVVNGETYTYYVTAVNSAGESEKSKEISATPVGLPTPPRNLQAIVENGYVKLTWQPPSYNGGSNITYYKIYRGTSSGGEIYIGEVNSSTLNYTDRSVRNGITYYYYVTAVNSVWESYNSTEVQVSVSVPQISKSSKSIFGNFWFEIGIIIGIVVAIIIIIIVVLLRKRG